MTTNSYKMGFLYQYISRSQITNNFSYKPRLTNVAKYFGETESQKVTHYEMIYLQDR